MKKKLIGILVCMFMISSASFSVVGMSKDENFKPNDSTKLNNQNNNYNLVQQLNPTRTLFPHIYRRGSVATFDAYIINEGPDESDNYTLHLKWSRIFGGIIGVIFDGKWGEYGPLNSGYRRHVYLNFECWINGMGINIYELQITNTADDLNPDDNIAKIRYIVIGMG
jgi:hypothetical protein